MGNSNPWKSTMFPPRSTWASYNAVRTKSPSDMAQGPSRRPLNRTAIGSGVTRNHQTLYGEGQPYVGPTR